MAQTRQIAGHWELNTEKVKNAKECCYALAQVEKCRNSQAGMLDSSSITRQENLSSFSQNFRDLEDNGSVYKCCGVFQVDKNVPT